MAIYFLTNSELKGSTFRSRLINFSGRDISEDVFSLLVKNNFGTVVKTIVPIVQGNAVLFQLTEIEALASSTYILEYWGEFAGLGKEMIIYETFTITKIPNDAQKNKNISISTTVEIEDVVINLAISNPVVQVIGEGGGTITVTWENVQYKPETFTPSEHTHSAEDLPQFKTIGGQSIMGDGDIPVSGGSTIDGTVDFRTSAVNLYNKENNFNTHYVNSLGDYLTLPGTTTATLTRTFLPVSGTYSINQINISNNNYRFETEAGVKLSGGAMTTPTADGIGRLITASEPCYLVTMVQFNNAAVPNLDTYQIQPGSYVTSHEYNSTVKGIDEKTVYQPFKSRFTGKYGIAFGDSITDKNYMPYLPFMLEILGAVMLNKGSSGSRTGRLLNYATEIKDRSDTGAVATPDYTGVNFVTCMIGANPDEIGSVDSLPVGSILNQATDADKITWLKTFPNDYIGNLAILLEYWQWKAPLMEIFMISPVQKSLGNNHIINCRTALIDLQKIYGFHLIDATYESGLNQKNLMRYSTDGTHLNELGRRKLGYYLGGRISGR